MFDSPPEARHTSGVPPELKIGLPPSRFVLASLTFEGRRSNRSVNRFWGTGADQPHYDGVRYFAYGLDRWRLTPYGKKVIDRSRTVSDLAMGPGFKCAPGEYLCTPDSLLEGLSCSQQRRDRRRERASRTMRVRRLDARCLERNDTAGMGEDIGCRLATAVTTLEQHRGTTECSQRFSLPRHLIEVSRLRASEEPGCFRNVR